MRRIYPSILLAGVLALCLTGGAVAASQITGNDIRNNTITGKDIRDRSLVARDFKRGQLPRGPQGPQGPAGPVNVGATVRVAASATIPAGGVDGVTVTCPAGYSFISGGFQSISADGEIFFTDTFGSKTSWSVGLDNFDSTLPGDVAAIAWCAPSGKAVVASVASTSRVRSKVDALVERRLAAHGK